MRARASSPRASAPPPGAAARRRRLPSHRPRVRRRRREGGAPGGGAGEKRCGWREGVGGVIEGVRLMCGPHERVVGIEEKYEGRWVREN
jgi:hypothetical protein